ncbi:hypothetical protein BDR26DRAFT_212519 [Obelidium mucronatum]|nr:hypothetical protein BDR26DRAFT_212519 [Obelidium mucronatum]
MFALIWLVCLSCLAAASPEKVVVDTIIAAPDDCTVHAKEGDQLAIHYRGFLSSGEEFDTSYKNRFRPYVFTMGLGLVIKGWDEGLEGACVGEKRRLIIPPSLAYGDKGKGVIPPNETLVFETEVMNIVPKEARDL